MTHGDDPPVWRIEDQPDDTGQWTKQERLVSSSLSTFLVSFVLQELMARLSNGPHPDKGIEA